MTLNKHRPSIEGKIPPQAIEVEEQLISILLTYPAAFKDYQEIMRAAYFYKHTHALVFNAIERVANASKIIDMVSTVQQLKKDGKLKESGGAYAMSQITNKQSFPDKIPELIDELKSQYTKRKCIEEGHRLIAESYDPSTNGANVISNISSNLVKLDEETLEESTESIEDVFDNTIRAMRTAKDKDGVVGYPIHIPKLNEYLCGLQPGSVYVIAARPSVGKSALAKSIVIGLAKAKVKSKIFSLEMTAQQLMIGVLSELSGITNTNFTKGKVEESEIDKLYAYKKDILPYISIDDRSGITIQYMESKIRKFVRDGGKVIILDYLQLMKLTSKDVRNKSREQEVSFLTGNIKRIAKQYKVPVIELAQLSRDVEKRGGDKRPILSDLRESGAIEQDADVVILIHRPEMHGIHVDGAGNSTKGIARLILAKNRFGEREDVLVRFTGRTTTYSKEETDEDLWEEENIDEGVDELNFLE
jgi:replicative DNA helicase